jgi:hypothetical protein
MYIYEHNRRGLSILGSGLIAIAALVVPVGQSEASTVYNDTTGETIGGGNPHIDIVSVEVQNDGTDIMFTINLLGDPIATDWGKYMIGIDGAAGGDTAGNAWGRPISMSSGMDYWIGSWVDFGAGAEVYSWDGVSWALGHATYNPPSDIGTPALTTSSVKLTTTLSSLGLSLGDTFTFDVFTSGGGGGDTAVDALSDPNQTVADWPIAYNSTSTLTYTAVPEPTTLGLGAVSILCLALRRRKANGI